jgi:GTP-binding protein Era
MTPTHKAGFVNIVGNPNVGKSTLMNALVGERISIITSKAQTTRHRIMGIVNTDDMQIVFSDTPGVLKPVSKLHESMLAFSQSALVDADILLYLTDTVESPEKNEQFLEKVKAMSSQPDDSSAPQPRVIVVLNKMDLVDQPTLVRLVEEWHQRLPDAEIIPISALHGLGTDLLMTKIKELLPECPPYFEKDALTDKPARFFVTEIIREKILLLYDKEIPYSCEVSVESFKEGDDIIHISAIIYCERDSQKGILIGHKGSMLRRLGTLARKDIEAFFGKKVMLTTFIKVEKDWRNNLRDLNRFGYNPE